MRLKEIVFLVSLVFSGVGQAAVPTGDDFSKEMPLHDYLVKSIANDEDRKKMALSYYGHFSSKSPFENLVAYKLKKALEGHIAQNLWDFSNFLGRPYGSPADTSVRLKQKREVADAASYNVTDVEKMIDAKAPFDERHSSYIAWLFVASSEGGKVLPSWPGGTDPLVGTIIYKDAKAEQINYIPDLNSEFGVKAKKLWDKEQKDGAEVGINISPFENLVRKFGKTVVAIAKPSGLSDDQYHAYQLMKGVTLSIIYSQGLELRLFSPESIKREIAAPLGAYLDQQDANMASMALAKSIKIPVSKDEKRTDYARGFFESMSSSDAEIDLIKPTEDLVSKWYYVPLSKKSEPIKYAYRPISGFKKMMAWTVVEFTEKGIQTRSPSPVEERKVFQNFRWQWSPAESPYGEPRCDAWEISNNPCLRYRFGNFGHGRTLGVLRDVRFIDNASFGIPDLPVD